MNEQQSRPDDDDRITRADKFSLWLFVAAAMIGLGLGAWALIFGAI